MRKHPPSGGQNVQLVHWWVLFHHSQTASHNSAILALFHFLQLLYCRVAKKFQLDVVISIANTTLAFTQVLVQWQASSCWSWMSRFCCKYWRLISTSKFNFLLSFSLCRRDQLQETNGCTHYSCESVAPDPSKRWPQYKLWRRLLSRAANYWRDSTSRGLLQKITYCGLKNGFLRIWSTFEFSASPVTQRLQNGLLKRIRRMSTRLATILSRLLWCKYLSSTCSYSSTKHMLRLSLELGQT